MEHRLLLVDDDVFHLEATREFLEKRGFQVETAKSGSEAITKVKQAPLKYSLVILDYRMAGHNGAATAEALLAINPNIYIMVFSADPTRDAVLFSTRSGARAFVDKREGADFFLREVKKLCARYEAETLTVSHPRSIDENEKLIAGVGLVGCSAALADIAEKVSKLRDKAGPVLILGESGTGKELVARALHGGRPGAFKAVNCADFLMSKETARSELFGHTKGAFTGADADRKGIFEEASGGTVFLDEIYALPMEAQVGLLRTLQEKIVVRMGNSKEIRVDFRLVAAAKPDLIQDIARGTFKADLFYRISQNILTIPPLAERPEDIPLLVRHFCERWSKENGETRTCLASTIPYFQRYRWPGNVRELENVIYSMLNMSSKKAIGPEDLDGRFRTEGPTARQSAVGSAPLKVHLEAAEKRHLIDTLRSSRSLREAARRLGVSPQTVSRLVRKHNLSGDEVEVVNRLMSTEDRV